MNVTTPHYLAYVRSGEDDSRGRWGFELRRSDGAERIEASDVEPKVSGTRLDLLALVRALESLDQPSRVTFIGLRPEIERGIRYGLAEWRSNGWRWEWFGQMVPVRNCDLWQRVDRALRFHQVDCRRWRIDGPHLHGHSAGDSAAVDGHLAGKNGDNLGERPLGGNSPENGQPGKTAGQTAWGLRTVLINWLVYIDLMARRSKRLLALCFPARRFVSAY